MDYKEKYEQALEKMKGWAEGKYPECFDSAQKTAELIFPELKESEDEKMMNQLHSWMKEFGGAEEYTEKVYQWIKGLLEKQGEQKPCDTPNFHEGEWIVHQGTGNIYQVVAVIGNQYQLKDSDNYTTTQRCANVDRNARLWDMTKDVREGDVLYSLDSKRPFIFKHRKPHEQATAYCGINIYGEFFVWNTKDCIITTDKYIPAAKEQRESLERAISDAGYEWDANEKKLKKIEQEYHCTGVREPKEATGVLKQLLNKENYAWSEEDEAYRVDILVKLEPHITDDNFTDVQNWFKSIKDRVQTLSKQEWSEEDIEMINWLIRCCEKEHEELCNDRYGHQEIVSDLKRDCRKKWDWLESLKNKVVPQNTWKPSDAQLE